MSADHCKTHRQYDPHCPHCRDRELRRRERELRASAGSAPSCACETWARTDGKLTNHHPNCPRYNDSLIDVWRVAYDGTSYVTDHEPTIEAEEISGVETVTKERMHRELYENLPDFTGF